MPFDWSAFVALARDLKASPEPATEARLRTALSRAYFGAFCYARNYSQRWLRFQPSGTEEDHRRVRDYLWGKKRQNVARALDQLRRWRNTADYADDTGLDLASTVDAALQEAERVIAALPPPRPKRA